MPEHRLVEPLVDWYAANARDLPWRRPGTTPWHVLVSEVMLQQTPVVRVVPQYQAWVERWPTPRALAEEEPGEAVRAWGRLGYPRRALRLHAAAAACVQHHAGEVPSTPAELRALPGVGEYTAAAVLAFGFGRRCVVLDTNVRRVQARVLDGVEFEPPGATTAGERRRGEELLPEDDGRAAALSVALMELGALVCTARSPHCPDCPVASACSWLARGTPGWTGPARRGQSYAGTDRQCRGRLLGVLRESAAAVPKTALDAAWPDGVQRERALDSLVADGLVAPFAGDDGTTWFRLPVTVTTSG